MAHSPCSLSPPADSPLSPFVPLSNLFYLLGTLLAVTGSVHLGLRLLVNWPPLSQPFPQTLPLQIPRTPITQHLTKTTSGTIQRLMSGTKSLWLIPLRTIWLGTKDGTFLENKINVFFKNLRTSKQKKIPILCIFQFLSNQVHIVTT